MNARPAIDAYLQSLLDADRSPKTIKTYKGALKHFERVIGDAPLTEETYKTFLKSLRDYAPATQRIFKTAVKRMFYYAGVSLSQIQDDAYLKRQPVRLPTFDRDSIEKTITHSLTLSGDLLGLRDRAFIVTLADTGLRLSEACGLHRGDIDFNEQRAVIIGKGDKQAVVRFSTRSIQAIQDYLQARAKLDLNSGRAPTALPVFARHDIGAGKKVKPVGSSGMWRAVKLRIREAGGNAEAVRVHDFRHYFVTCAYIASGGDIKFTQEVARHANMQTTSRYAHLGEEIDRKYDQIFNQEEAKHGAD